MADHPESPPPFEKRVLPKFVKTCASWLRDTTQEMYHFFTSYASETQFIPGCCNDRCLRSAKKYAGDNHSIIWEARQFCKMGCDFPNLKTMTDCYRCCHVACRESRGQDVGLSQVAAETISKYNGDPYVVRTCLDFCTQGCGFRKPSLEPDEC